MGSGTPHGWKTVNNFGGFVTVDPSVRRLGRPVACRLKRGGTSLWEDWGNGASRNHIMFGEFVCWAYQYLAGIRLLDGGKGFGKITIDPKPIDALQWAKASIRLPTGMLSSSWNGSGSSIVLSVTLPRDIEAIVQLPSGQESIKGPTQRRFALK